MFEFELETDLKLAIFDSKFCFLKKILGYRDPRCKHENSSIITSVIRIEMKLIVKVR